MVEEVALLVAGGWIMEEGRRVLIGRREDGEGGSRLRLRRGRRRLKGAREWNLRFGRVGLELWRWGKMHDVGRCI